MAKNLPLNAEDFYKGKNPFIEVEKGAKALLITIDDMQKKLVAVNQELGKSMKSNVKETSTDYQKLNTQLSESEKNTQALNKINEEKAKLEATLLKLNKQAQQENEELNILIQNQKKANKELAKEQLGLVGAYQKLTKQTNDAQKKFKDLAAQFGTNSKQAKAARADFEKLDAQLRKVNDAAKDGRRDVGRYEKAWGGIKNVLGQGLGFLGITAGFAAVKKVFGDVIKSTQTLSDAWDATMKGMSFAYNKFVQSIATGNFSNFTKNLKEAFRAGREVSVMLDGLFESQAAYDIQRAKGNVEVSRLELITKNVTKADEERLQAAIKINQIEESLFKKNQKIKEDAYKAAIRQIEIETGLSREQFDFYFENYDKQTEIQEKLKEIDLEIQSGTANWERTKELFKTQDELRENAQRFFDINKIYQKSNDASVKAAIDSKKELILSEDEYLTLITKNSVRLAQLQEDIDKKNKEAADSQLNNLENLRKKVSELTAEIERGNLTDLASLANKQDQIDKINKEIESIEKLIKAKEGLKEANEIQFADEEIQVKEFDTGALFEDLENANKVEINAEIAKFEELKKINESGYNSLLDIFFKYSTKKKAVDENLSAEEITKLNESNQRKSEATQELVNTLISIYSNLLNNRIQQLDDEINATNQKIDETERSLDRELELQKQGAANNVDLEREKLETLKKQRDKDLEEKKKAQKKQEQVDKLQQVSALITAIANIIQQYSSSGPAGVVLGLLAAAAAVAGFVTYSSDAKTAVGEDGELLVKKGVSIESGRRHSQGGNKYSGAEFEQGEAHAVFSREATSKHYDDIKQFTNLVNDGKWNEYKLSMGTRLSNVIVNNDNDKLLKEAIKTNHILKNQLTPVFDPKGKLICFNINGVRVKAES